jgi:hypothetical protein
MALIPRGTMLAPNHTQSIAVNGAQALRAPPGPLRHG